MSVTRNIVSHLLSLLSFTDSAVKKFESFDGDQPAAPKGAVAVEFLSFTPAHPQCPKIPDYEMSFVIKGRTFVREDPDKERLRTMLHDVATSLSLITIQALQPGFPLGAVVYAILPVGAASIREDPDYYEFAIGFKIIAGNFTF